MSKVGRYLINCTTMRYWILTGILVYLTLCACVREESFSEIPEISFIGQTKTVLDQGALMEDSLLIQFDFRDGDGDIGSDDSINVFITDTRQDFATAYKIPLLETDSDIRSLEGTVTLLLFTSCCLYDDNSQAPCTPSTTQPTDEVIYTIQIRDRAGNLSNVVEMDPITLRCN